MLAVLALFVLAVQGQVAPRRLDITHVGVDIEATTVRAGNFTEDGEPLATQEEMERLRDWITSPNTFCADPACNKDGIDRVIKFYPYAIDEVCATFATSGNCLGGLRCDAVGNCSKYTWAASDFGCAAECTYMTAREGFGPFTMSDFCFNNLTNPGGACSDGEVCDITGKCRRVYILLFTTFAWTIGASPPPTLCQDEVETWPTEGAGILWSQGRFVGSGARFARCGDSSNAAPPNVLSNLEASLPIEASGAPVIPRTYLLLSGSGGSITVIGDYATMLNPVTGGKTLTMTSTKGTAVWPGQAAFTGCASDGEMFMWTGAPTNCDLWSDWGTWATPPYTGQTLFAGLSTGQDPLPNGWLQNAPPDSCGPALSFPWLCWTALQFPDTWDAVEDLFCDPRCVHTPTLSQDLPPSLSDMCYRSPHPSATCPTGWACSDSGRCGPIDVLVFMTDGTSSVTGVGDGDIACQAEALGLPPLVTSVVVDDPTAPGTGGWHAARCESGSLAASLPLLVSTYGGAHLLRLVNDAGLTLGAVGSWDDPVGALTDGGWVVTGGGSTWELTGPAGITPPGSWSAGAYTGCTAGGVEDPLSNCATWTGGGDGWITAAVSGAGTEHRPEAGWIGGTATDALCNVGPDRGWLCWAPIVIPDCSMGKVGAPPECDDPKFACNTVSGQCEQYFWDAVVDFGCDTGCVNVPRRTGFGVTVLDMCYTDWNGHGCVDGRLCSSTGWVTNGYQAAKCTMAATFIFITESTVTTAADLGGELTLDDFCMTEASKPGSVTKGLMDAGYIPAVLGSPTDGFRAMRCESNWGGGPPGLLGSAPYYMFGSSWGGRTTDEGLTSLPQTSMLGWLISEFKLYDQFGVERGHQSHAWTGCAGVFGTDTSWDGGAIYNTCGDWTDGTAGSRGEISTTGSPVPNAGIAGPWWIGPLNFDTRSKTCDTSGQRRLCWAPIDVNTFPVCEDSSCALGWRCGPLHACVQYDGWNCQDTATGAVECDAAGTVNAFTPTVADACLSPGSVGGCGGGETCNAHGFCQLCIVDGDCTALDARFGCDAGVCRQRDWDAFNDFSCSGSCVHTATISGTYGVTVGDMCYRWLDSYSCVQFETGYEVGMNHRWCDNYGRCQGPPDTYLVTSPESSGGMDGHQGDDLGAAPPGYECEEMARAGAVTGSLDVAQWYHAAGYARDSPVSGDPCLFRNIPDESPYKDPTPLIDYIHPTYYYNALGTSIGISMLDIFGNSPGGVPVGGAGLSMYDVDGIAAGTGARAWSGCSYTNNVGHTSTPSAATNLWTCSAGMVCNTAVGWDDASTINAGRAALSFGAGGVTQDRWICPPIGALDTPVDCAGTDNTRWLCWGLLNTGGIRMRVYDYVDHNCDYACDIRPADVPGLAPASVITSFNLPIISDLCFVSGEVARCTVGTCNAGGQCV